MRDIGPVREALSEFSDCVKIGNYAAIPTQHVYPSNGGVTIYVQTDTVDHFSVSDGSGAMDELSTMGLYLERPDQVFGSVCRQLGVRSTNGLIHSQSVSIDGLANAIVFVALASSRSVEHAMARLKPSRHRDLSAMVDAVITSRYSPERVVRNEVITGASNRQYSFDFSIHLPNEGRLLVDLVLPEPQSINAKVVSHLDVARVEDTAVFQRIVYDDGEEWDASDLSLMQMAATTVPFSKFGNSLDRLLAH